DNLPFSVKALNPLVKSNTREMKFSNGSIVRVVTSARSGTTNFLHISEFGKICAKSPEKAREVVTGSLNTVAPGQFIFIESTAEGREGAFFDMTQEAIRFQLEGKELSLNDYSFHFYPWYQEPAYVADPATIVISKNMHEYFDLLERMEQIIISQEQRAWYCKKKITQKEDMKREYPSTPKEAFEQSIIGAYFPDEMGMVRAEGRIRRVSYEPRLPVYTFWDIGRDTTSIWFMQYYAITEEYRFINYMQSCNHSLQWYVKEIGKLGYVFDTHFFPHDADVHSLDNPDEETRADVLRKLGMNIQVVGRIDKKYNAIQATRDILGNCYFDEEKCEEGIKHLDHYRKEWDDKLGTYKNDKPLHDSHSHGADSFQQFATGFKIPKQYTEVDLIPEVENVW
ncbi:MAG: terminase, partial [Bacteroidetes bacterium]